MKRWYMIFTMLNLVRHKAEWKSEDSFTWGFKIQINNNNLQIQKTYIVKYKLNSVVLTKELFIGVLAMLAFCSIALLSYIGEFIFATAIWSYALWCNCCIISKCIIFACLNFWDEAWWFLSFRVFTLLSSSLLLYSQCFGQCVLWPSSEVTCWTQEPTWNFEPRPLFNPWGRFLVCSQDWTCNLQMIVSKKLREPTSITFMLCVLLDT